MTLCMYVPRLCMYAHTRISTRTHAADTETEAESRIRSLAGEAFGTAFKQLGQTYDDARGGFGRRLKFPRPAELNFLVGTGRGQGQHRVCG